MQGSSFREMRFTALCFKEHSYWMNWSAYFHPKFKAEFDKLSVAVQDELLAMLIPLQQHGPYWAVQKSTR